MSFLSNLKNSKNTRSGARTTSRVKVIYVEDYPDNHTVTGIEMTLDTTGLVPVRDSAGEPVRHAIKLNDKDYENRPRISSLVAKEGDWNDYVEKMMNEFQKYQETGRCGLVGTVLDDLIAANEGVMTLEGALRKNCRIVEPGGLLQFDGCEEKEGYLEANWVRTLSPTWGERIVIPPGMAMIAIQPVTVTVEKAGGEKVRLIGEAAAAELNKMTAKEAIEKARVPVDIILPAFAKVTRANVPQAIEEQFTFLCKAMQADRNASVYVRIMQGKEPIMVFKTGLGGEVTGTRVVDGEEVDHYEVRTPESAVARHLENTRVLGDNQEMTYADIYESLAMEEGISVEVIPAISTTYGKMMKMKILKDVHSGCGDVLLDEATGEFVVDRDENGKARTYKVDTIDGPVEKEAKRFVSCFTSCITASLSLDPDKTYPSVVRFKAHLPKSNENYKAYPLLNDESLPGSYTALEVKRPASIVAALGNSKDSSAPESVGGLDDIPDLKPPRSAGMNM